MSDIDENILLSVDDKPSTSGQAADIANMQAQLASMSHALKRVSDTLDATGEHRGSLAKKAKSRSTTQTSDDEEGLFDEDHSSQLNEDNSDDDFLNALEEDLGEIDKVGPPVQEKLAKIVNARFQNDIAYDKLKTKLELYNRPSNCESMAPPKVNETIWRKSKTHNKSRDKRLTNIQTTVSTAAVALLEITTSLLDKDKTLARKGMDAIALLGHASHQLSQRRREFLAYGLGKGLARLASDTVPITSQLFGDDSDLPKNLSDAKKLDQLGNDNSKNWQGRPWGRPPNRFSPYRGRQYNQYQSYTHRGQNRPRRGSHRGSGPSK